MLAGYNDDDTKAEAKEQCLSELGNVEAIVVIVHVEVVVLELLHHVGLVGEHQVGDQEWLEHVVKVRDHTEVVQWDESAQLHVLNQGPKWKETNITKEKE